ncbi:hypothetical protein A2160_01160 [Candidatus Beckwithbacteria bacterium RBG_13_42_9]|uniref:Septum formation initiator n=1 Tax=Candidatus Beckwithbacteria bacterium RBG_13_42_9 TaxID=1797457 RepID=A0A1F5E3U3_9BACT|nr:MAG: hypothetical protein A2160_01160 [Candidatus Beckwithbacteria bacterium RBG_13_42_9]
MNFRRIIKFFLVVIALIFIVNLTQDLLRLWRAGDRIQQQKQKLAAEQAENAKLKQEQYYLGSQFFFEEQIRDKLNMVKPGEVIVILPLNSGSPQPEGIILQRGETETLPTWRQWLNLFW